MKNILFLLSFLFTYAVAAQEQSITVEISPDNVLMGNEFELTFIVENVEIRSFDAPAFKDFRLIAGPMTSSMMQIINGKTSSRQSYTYILEPVNPGKFYIEPAFANLKDGSVLETQAIEITVQSNPEGIRQEKKSRKSQFDEFFRSPQNPRPAEKQKAERKTYKI